LPHPNAGAQHLLEEFGVRPSRVVLALATSAVLLSMGGVADQALGRHAVNMIRPEARGRVNGLFTGSFFVGGALGAALAGPAWSAGGWMGVCAIAAVPARILVMRRTAFLILLLRNTTASSLLSGSCHGMSVKVVIVFVVAVSVAIGMSLSLSSCVQAHLSCLVMMLRSSPRSPAPAC
jgi:hypothetical protein